jgi:hypothetical protein
LSVAVLLSAGLDLAGLRPGADCHELGIIPSEFRLANKFDELEPDGLELAEQQLRP